MARVDQHGPLFLVRYEHPEDMRPSAQRGLVEALQRQSVSGAVAILFDVDRGLAGVDPAVPKFWLGTLDEATVRIAAMAIVSDSLAVRMAASAFDITNILRRKPVTVKGFQVKDRGAARQWLTDLLHGVNTPAPPPGPRPSM